MAKKTAQVALPFVEVKDDPALELARGLRKLDVLAVVGGLDEVGRGPLAGPVVAACCVLPEPLPDVLLPLNDSKQLSEEQREALYPHIVAHATAWAVAGREAARIDEINILHASLEAMVDAFMQCEAKLGRAIAGAVVDGNTKAPLPTRVVQRCVIGGDALSRPIMAASILAKVTRDRRMRREHEEHPQYGFDEHKGYGTPKHLEALRAHGPCVLHRRSFAPVRDADEARRPAERR